MWDTHEIGGEILQLTGSYSRGVCLVCKKTIAKGSQKVINGYDICNTCYFEDAHPKTQRLMFLLNQYEQAIKFEAKQQEQQKR